MFSITRKIAIAISLVVVCLGNAYACPLEAEIKRPTQAISALPLDVIPLILDETSKGSLHPVNFRLVCKEWTTLMDKVNNPNQKNSIQLHGDFMQHCLKIWAFERFKNGKLRFRNSGKNIEQLFKFADLGNECKGTFELSTCGDMAENLIITTVPEQFFQVEVGEGKLLMLIALYQDIAPKINSSAWPFASIMNDWDPAKAPVIMAWRVDTWDLSWFDYLTSESLSELSRETFLTKGFNAIRKEHVKNVIGEGWNNYECEVSITFYCTLPMFCCQFFEANG